MDVVFDTLDGIPEGRLPTVKDDCHLQLLDI
jgi:hypothetical protein